MDTSAIERNVLLFYEEIPSDTSLDTLPIRLNESVHEAVKVDGKIKF